MSLEGDFLWGIVKPLKDAASAFGLYAILILTTNFSELPATAKIFFPFNVWMFLVLFGGISFFDDLISQAIIDFKKSYSEPIDQLTRLFGMMLGMIFFGGPLALIYGMSGGSFGDAFLSWVISFGILIFTMIIRVQIAKFNRSMQIY
jgi:hypothetical protein